MFFDPSVPFAGWAGALSLFFAFAILHSLGDFALQNDFMALAKKRGADLSRFFGGDPPRLVWIHVLSAHALIQAGGVWLVSGSAVLGGVEFVLHWVIDCVKGEELTSFHVDQFLHHGCKVLYVALFFWAPSML